MQLSNIELYLTFHAHVSALDQLYSRHWHCTNDYCELNVLQQDNVATVYQPLCLIHMITVHKSCLISLTWWYGHWSTQENMFSKWLSANHRCESQVGLVSSVYKEWTLKDPWWCDAWSNVNGARHHPAQFWDEADARHKPKMPEVESIPPPCPIPSSPPTSRALRILQLPRLLLRAGHSGQTRETMGARREPCRWAADLLHSASAAFWGRASAKAQSLAEKKHKQGKFAGGHLRLAGSEDGTLNSKKDSQKETIRCWTEAWRVLQCLGWAFLLPAHSYFFFWRLKINSIKTPKMWNIFRPPAQMHVSASSSETIR